MNFDFSDELKQLRDQARRFMAEKCPPAIVRRSLDGQEPFAAELWQEIGAMGWVGAAIHAFVSTRKVMDGRDKPGHDNGSTGSLRE